MDQYTESLVEEGLKDAAETFFGARKSLEDEIDRYQAKGEELRKIGKMVASRCATLAALLPGDESLDGFRQILGGSDWDFPGGCRSDAPEAIRAAKGLTRSGRYAKTLLRAYVRLEGAVREYREGVFKDDPDIPGKKVRTVHYKGLMAWSEELNRKTAKVNQYHSPSMAMQFAKKLDVNAQRKEEAAGAPLQYSLDRDMAFRPVDFAEFGLDEWPELPGQDKVKKAILGFAREQYKKDPKGAWERLRSLSLRKE